MSLIGYVFVVLCGFFQRWPKKNYQNTFRRDTVNAEKKVSRNIRIRNRNKLGFIVSNQTVVERKGYTNRNKTLIIQEIFQLSKNLKWMKCDDSTRRLCCFEEYLFANS